MLNTNEKFFEEELSEDFLKELELNARYNSLFEREIEIEDLLYIKNLHY